MSSESVAESSVPVSAVAIVEAGKKRGRPPAGQVTIKLDADTRLHACTGGTSYQVTLPLAIGLTCRTSEACLYDFRAHDVHCLPHD